MNSKQHKCIADATAKLQANASWVAADLAYLRAFRGGGSDEECIRLAKIRETIQNRLLAK